MSKSLAEQLLTIHEKVWLEAIFEKELAGEEIDERVLRVELRDKLPKDFTPSKMSSQLLRGKTGITLIGIALIAPESELLKITNKVFEGIRQILTSEPRIQNISAQQISDITSLSIAKIEEMFKRLSEIGVFHSSGLNGTNGWSAINIDEKAFDSYFKYATIEEYLLENATLIYYSRGFDINPVQSPEISTIVSSLNASTNVMPDSRKIFVVHGRNLKVRDALFAFLRSIGLEPIEWIEAVKSTGKPTPYVGEVLDAAFSIAQAIVVLFTPDDEARLLSIYQTSDEEEYEKKLTPQARPNVLFEAGMAMGRNPDRTVLIEVGRLRPFSDIGGRHIIKLNNSTERRQELAQRLEIAGCAVKLTGTDWHKAGMLDFENGDKPFSSNDVSNPSNSIADSGKEVVLTNSQIKVLGIIANERGGVKVEMLWEKINIHHRHLEDDLSELTEGGYLDVLPIVVAGQSLTYMLTRKGRKYCLNNKLI